MKKTLGGDRLGSGKKISVDLHGYERSTHDIGYIWRSTMATGTLVPFLCEIALPGDTFNIDLDVDVKTHPTIGPLFGSYKIQLDVFQAPIRLYQAQLHNNKLGIGMNMANVKLPQMTLYSNVPDITGDFNNAQINPSCILNYLGIKGVGVKVGGGEAPRNFNAIPLIAYWDIYKNYYANKQEEIGAVIHTIREEQADIVALYQDPSGIVISELPAESAVIFNSTNSEIRIEFTGLNPPDINQVMVKISVPLSGPETVQLSTIVDPIPIFEDVDTVRYQTNRGSITSWTMYGWTTAGDNTPIVTEPVIHTFPLENIDKLREDILAQVNLPTAYILNDLNLTPYSLILGGQEGVQNMIQTQEGLGVKTYQSDLLNNWLSTEWIDGPTGINAITAIDTSGDSFTLDTLNLSKKVYDMLNRIAVSGGTYDDWLDAVYTHDRYVKCETPMYMGGMIRELVFQEVVSNSESADQPLGTLAGKGVMAKKTKGGKVTIKVDEPSYIIGIISLTPRIDYSQGNKWHIHLQTMDDLHKPALDEIGFQELITEQMAWWDTKYNDGAGIWVTKSAGKQPAWINYMTNVNETHGNFAIENSEMFMTLNRRYEPGETIEEGIIDVTTYIDPKKFNFIFAETALDAQNFWAQIAVDITARRKMSAKVMPNL